MAKEDVQKCLEWLLNTQNELETDPFGICKAAILEASIRQQNKSSELLRYQDNIKRVMTRHRVSDDDTKEISNSYESVMAISSKRASCMEVLGGIASLEEQVENLSHDFDERAVHLVNLGENNKHTGSKSQSNESLVKTAKNCHVAVRNNWRWIDTMLQCTQVHLRNAAMFHEYFHEVDEVEYWMNTTLSRIHLTFDRSKLSGDHSDVKVIQEEMKDMLLAYLQWQSKVDSLFDRARDIVPIQSRLEKLQDSRPVVSLTDYNTNEIEFLEGETLTLLDNSKKGQWLVKNSRGQSALVPSVILLLRGPSSDALEAAIRLRIQLLGMWTTSIKRLGYQMIAFMGLVFRDWTDQEIQMLQCMNDKERKELLGVLKYIEDTLLKNWNGYGGFEELQEKILRLRMILEESDGKATAQDSEMLTQVVVQIKSLKDLLNNYKDFWAYWETYKGIVELLKAPKFLLVCDKWDELKFVTSAHFVKFWDTSLDLEKEDLTKATSVTVFETPKEAFPTENRKPVEELLVCQVQPLQQEEEGLDILDGYEEEESYQTYEETTVTSADQVDTSVQEERSTFVITSVTDPRDDDREWSLQEAIMLGIIDQTDNTYINPDTGEVCSITSAMNDGKIMFEFTSRKKIREEKKSYGIISIKTTKENRPYTISHVVDPSTDKEMTVSQAVSKGILNKADSTYKTETGELISIDDAISSGLVKVEYQNGGDHPEAESTTRTYAVHGVLDKRTNQKVSFADALNKGLLDRERGEYVDNVTNERFPVLDAIMKGFIKARIVTDTSKLDIDPENKMVVEKFASAKTKLNAAKAFRGVTNGHN
nr:plectin-like isoform X4 [Crassostrea virginica]XP_022288568.1 plectin-like isoform X4 [Crassostrea virginica]XP_022288569.1 plectin-like isoform X4 [Crassostrea virginica]